MHQSRIVGLGGIWSVTAFTVNIVVSLALIAVLPIMIIWPFGGSHHPSVEVQTPRPTSSRPFPTTFPSSSGCWNSTGRRATRTSASAP